MKKGIQISLLCFFMIALFFYGKQLMYSKEKTKESPIKLNVESENVAFEMTSQKQVGEVFSEDELWDFIAPTSVKIESSSTIGRGSIFLIDNKHILVASNQHVLVYANDPTILFFDGTSAPGIVVGISEQSDFAIVEVNIEDVPSTLLKRLYCVTLYQEDVIFPETRVYVFSLFEEIAFEKLIGMVKNHWEYHPEFHSFMGRAEGVATNGMSGAGVFNENGYYVGMLSGGKDEEFVFLPIEIIEEEWKLLGGEND